MLLVPLMACSYRYPAPDGQPPDSAQLTLREYAERVFKAQNQTLDRLIGLEMTGRVPQARLQEWQDTLIRACELLNVAAVKRLQQASLNWRQKLSMSREARRCDGVTRRTDRAIREFLPPGAVR